MKTTSTPLALVALFTCLAALSPQQAAAATSHSTSPSGTVDTVTSLVPSIAAVTPSTGITLGGTSVTLTGTGFTGATAVTFGSTAATSVVVSNATTITAVTPAHAAGAVSVLVTTPNGTNAANTLYTYVVPAPTVATTTATALTTTAATLNGTVNPNGFATTAEFQYGLTTSYGSTASITLSPNDGTTAQNVSANLTGLTPGTLYHYRLVAQNGATTAYGADMSFTTLTAYQVWAVANGVSTDPTANGGANLKAFAFGYTPGSTGALVYTGTFTGNGVITATGDPVTRFENITNGVDFRAVFVRRKDHLAVGLTYTPQFTGDLSTWANSATVPTVLADDGTNQIVSVPYPFFVAGKKARFFRLSVTVTP